MFQFRLSDSDRAELEAVLEQSNGQKMITLIGDCGAEYRQQNKKDRKEGKGNARRLHRM
jgi:RecB family endonuclease NucS